MQTPLFPIYQKYQAKVIDFHGWDLPVQFNGIIQEHLTVRKEVGLFDVSHMGEIYVEGPDATDFLNYVLTNQISSLKSGSIRYSPLCFDNGGTVDDLLVYCFHATKYLLVINASNIEKDFNWLKDHLAAFQVSLRNISEETAQIAIQGPNAQLLLSEFIKEPFNELKYYQFLPQVHLNQTPALISRTGYTGEDGFEIYCEANQAISIWEILLGKGIKYGLKPIGLGARDTLRFEACLPLYGNELSENISPLEANLKRFINLQKPDFIGKKALVQQELHGIPRRLIGLEMIERGIPRSGCQIYHDNQIIGYVTSGSYCPSLEKNLALALIDSRIDTLNAKLQVAIRGKFIAAQKIPIPFYTKQKGESK